MPNFPPGIPQQSMPAGWLRKISWCEEQIKMLSKQIVLLEKRVKELEVDRSIDRIVSIVHEDEAASQKGPGTVTEVPAVVKRGPGRPRKNPIEPQT